MAGGRGDFDGARRGALATRAIQVWLYGVVPLGPVTFVGTAAGMFAIAAVAAYLPARQAARIDPIIAVRTD